MGIGKKIKRTVLLPKSIVEEVNRFEISPTQRSYAFKFIWFLIRDSQRKHDNIYSPVERTFQDLEANYTKHYYKWIKLLLRSKLVKRISYSKNNCFKYYLKADKLYSITSGLLCSPNLEEDLILVTIFDKIYPQDQYQIWFNQDINSLTMDKKELEPLFRTRVENVTVQTSKIKVVEELLAGRYKLYSPYGQPGNRRFFSHDEINIRSKLTNTSIIVSKKGVILDDLSRFFWKEKGKYNTLW